MMPLPKRPFRLVVQRVAGDRGPKFRVVVYGDDPVTAIADHDDLAELVKTLKSTLPQIALEPLVERSVIFAGEVELDDSQMKTLGLA